jgi:hypothetical protein
VPNRCDTNKIVRCIMFTLATSVDKKRLTGRHWIWVNSLEEPNPSNSVTKLNLHPYHEMGQPSPNRSVDNTEQFLVLALYAARNKTDASFDCQSVSRRRLGEVFLVDDWLCIGGINGREGETAALLSRCLFTLNLCGGGFAPRQFGRWAAIIG